MTSPSPVAAVGLPAALGLALLGGCLAVRAETVYVSDEQADVVHLIEPPQWSVAERIAVGRRPRGLALSPDGKTLYVATSTDNRITAIDVQRRTVTGYLPSGPTRSGLR